MKVLKCFPILGMFILPACQQDEPPPTGGDTYDRYLEFMVDLIAKVEQGDADAQFSLGTMYLDGQGVPQDYIQAHMWYNLAASDPIGEDRELTVKNRDLVAEKMTSEQIAEAQRLAREWKPKTGSQ